MKRYDALVDVDGTYMGMDDDTNGLWVEAEVAQALYDELNEALVWYRSEMEICEDDDNEYVASQWRERINDAAAALSLADGETE